MALIIAHAQYNELQGYTSVLELSTLRIGSINILNVHCHTILYFYNQMGKNHFWHVNLYYMFAAIFYMTYIKSNLSLLIIYDIVQNRTCACTCNRGVGGVVNRIKGRGLNDPVTYFDLLNFFF